MIVRHIRVLKILKFWVNIIHSDGLNKSLNSVFIEDWIKIGNTIDINMLNRIKVFLT